METRCREGMGQTGHAKPLPQVFGKLHLGTAQHQSGQNAAPPRPHNLLQPLSKMTSQISQRRPWVLQHLDAFDPLLTPTALARQTLGRSRQ